MSELIERLSITDQGRGVLRVGPVELFGAICDGAGGRAVSQRHRAPGSVFPLQPQFIIPLQADVTDLARCAKDFLDTRAQVLASHGVVLDFIEWRVDTLGTVEPLVILDAAKILRKILGQQIAILATVRSQAQGGQARIDLVNYQKLVLDLAQSGLVDAVDVEVTAMGPAHLRQDTESKWLLQVHQLSVVFASAHFWKYCPRDSSEVLDQFKALDRRGVDVLKLAYYPQNNAELLALINGAYLAAQNLDKPLIVIGMGPWGMPTRILGPDNGNSATFVALQKGQSSAPGQLDLQSALHLFGGYSCNS